jgi:hypothetical protein
VTPEKVLQALVEYQIDLAPVVDKNGILLWTAAVVKLAPDGWQNFVSERDFAQGDTPQEAVGTLVALLVRQSGARVPTEARTQPGDPRRSAPVPPPLPAAPAPAALEPPAAFEPPALIRVVVEPLKKPRKPRSKPVPPEPQPPPDARTPSKRRR